MRYLSVCSGIEAASVAWEPLGWEAAAFSEIEPFPCAVLAARFPTVPNMGDMTAISELDLERIGPVDLLVGGTPCQSFSVAGRRAGLADVRGQLALSYARIAGAAKPRWVVWENVPGVLSADGGWAFAAFVRSLVELGYRCAWRVLDAQYVGVPQRRRRVFVVGHLGAGPGAESVLFEPEGGARNPAARCEAEPEHPAGVGAGAAGRVYGGGAGGRRDVAPALTAHGSRLDFDTEAFVVDARQDPSWLGGRSLPLGANDTGHAVAIMGTVTHTLMGEGFDASEDGAGRGTPITARHGEVRRITPTEAERLQGFSDNWTRIAWRGKAAADCPDGHRHKACGNSMAVPVMRWIGERIAAYESE